MHKQEVTIEVPFSYLVNLETLDEMQAFESYWKPFRNSVNVSHYSVQKDNSQDSLNRCGCMPSEANDD